MSAADTNRLAADQQTVRTYLAIEQPRTVFTARVNGSPTPGDVSVPFTSGIEYETTRLSYTLWVSATGFGRRDKGAVRLRAVYPDHIEVSFNHIDWESGDYLTVVNQVRPWTSFPQGEIEEGIFTYEDQNAAVGTYNESFPPLPRIGPSAAVAFIEGDGKARLKFYQDSYSLDALTLTHAWTFDSGTPATSSAGLTQSSPLEVTWSTPGQYMVHYTVSDTAGHSSERWCRVFIFARDEANGPITDMAVDSLSGSYEDGGWSLQGKLYGVSARYIEGAMVVAFSEQFWGSEFHNITHPGDWQYRDNILFVGWINRSRTLLKSDRSTVSFDAYGPHGWMKESASWPSDIKESGGTGWHFIPDCTPDKVFLHLLWWHTNMSLLADAYLTETALDLKYVQIQEGNLYGQIDQQVYDSLKARLVANRFGQLRAERNPQLIPTASRDSWVRDWLMITKDDSRDEISLGDEIDNPRVAQVDYTGFYYQGEDPHGWSSFAPARELSTGTIERITGTRILTQDEANQLAGLHLAHLNNIFNDVEFPWRGFVPLDISPSRRIYLTLTEDENERGLVWSAKSFWVRGVSHEFGQGSVLTTLKLEAESDGPPGVTHIIPDSLPDPNDPASGGDPSGDPVTPDPPEISVPTVPPATPPSEGTLLWEVEADFGTVVTSSAVNSTGVVLAGYRYASPYLQNRFECRSKTDGSIIWEFEVDAFSEAVLPRVVADDDYVYATYFRYYVPGAFSAGYLSKIAGRLLKIDATDGSIVTDTIFGDGTGGWAVGLTHDTTHLYMFGKGGVVKKDKATLSLTYFTVSGNPYDSASFLHRAGSYLVGGGLNIQLMWNPATGAGTTAFGWNGIGSGTTGGYQQMYGYGVRVVGDYAYFMGRRIIPLERVAQLEKWSLLTENREWVAKGVSDYGGSVYGNGDLQSNRAVIGGQYLMTSIFDVGGGALAYEIKLSLQSGDVLHTSVIEGDYVYSAGTKNAHWYVHKMQLDNS